LLLQLGVETRSYGPIDQNAWERDQEYQHG
jgi:hypothetical protein